MANPPIQLAELAEVPWDAVVIGAGVAGGLATALLADRGWRILLVERQPWPRSKACGGCLNAAGVRMLRSVGLEGLVAGATALTRFDLHVGRRRLSVEVPAGVAVARRMFDAGLVDAAQRWGRGAVTFVPDCAGRLLEDEDPGACSVRLKRGDEEVVVRGGVLLACDGINGSSLQEHPWAAWQPAGDAWIGVAATLAETPRLAAAVDPSAIAMYVARGGEGYVGLVRQQGSRIHVGAAVSPAACNRAHGPAAMLAGILAEHGMDGADLASADFEGTRPLTGVRAGVAHRRVLVVGDSCGYVEPFTGEGMSWAIRGAIGAVSMLPQQIGDWPPEMETRWTAFHAREVFARQAWCRRIRGLVRHPRVAGAFVGLSRCLPGVAKGVARRIGA
jgi:flavin-dependent dehydrogenase